MQTDRIAGDWIGAPRRFEKRQHAGVTFSFNVFFQEEYFGFGGKFADSMSRCASDQGWKPDVEHNHVRLQFFGFCTASNPPEASPMIGKSDLCPSVEDESPKKQLRHN